MLPLIPLPRQQFNGAYTAPVLMVDGGACVRQRPDFLFDLLDKYMVLE
jgi:hypothetical protein